MIVRRRLLLGLAVFALPVAVTVWMLWPLKPVDSIEELTGDVSRGAYLARMAGCIACHTDGDNNGDFLAGGPELNTGFGTFRAPNLTSDPEHGLGDWTLSEFATAVREGISPSGQPYYPAFPYEFYQGLTDQQVADLWAAFQTVPGVNQPDPPQKLQFPFNIRALLKPWRVLMQKEAPPNVSDDSVLERGRWIVEGPAHCGACHTPRNALGGIKANLALSGNSQLPGGGKAPDITATALLKNGWTEDDLAYALQTGLLPNGDAFGGEMAEVVLEGTGFLTWDDLIVISTFLLDDGS